MNTAIVFPEKDRIELQKISDPTLQPRELLVRSEFSGVSQGTEIWALTGRRPELAFPTVPGYQAVGIIEKLGEEVVGYEVGQRVLFHRSRLPQGWPDTWMATHVELAAVPVDNVPPPQVVPEGVDPMSASLAAMIGVSLRGIEMVDIRLGDLVVVAGQGLIGQASAQLARLRGATVVTTDLSSTRRELSRRYSADIVIDPRSQDLAEQVKSWRPNGADVVIDTTGRSEAFAECIGLLRWEGQFLMQGYYPRPITFDFHATHNKKPKIAISCGIGDMTRVMELLRYGKLNWREMVTDCVPVAQAPAMYARLAKGDPDLLGVVFDWRKGL